MTSLNKHDVFISYKSEDLSEARRVRLFLESNGVTCWMAPDSIPVGSSYAAEITDAIENCRMFLLLMSEKAQMSVHIPKELELANLHRKTILPYMIEECELHKEFKYYLSNLQWFEAYRDKEQVMDALLHWIKGTSGNQSVLYSTNITQSKENKQEKRSRHWIGIILMVVPYILGLCTPLYLLYFEIEFVLWMRVLYFGWILLGTYWVLNEIETNPRIAALCFGTLLEEELNSKPDVVFSRIAGVFGSKSLISKECPDGFVSYYRMRLLEFGSWDGKKVNYLKIEFRNGFERYDPSVFYLHTLSRGGQAVKMLLRQGFILKTPPDCFPVSTVYLTRGEIHISLYHKKRSLHGAIIYNCPEEDIASHYQGEWKDE